MTGIYLIAQLVGAGALLQALAGIDFAIAVVICGVFMTVYIVFGGMLATTWIQIIKAAMLMIAGVVISVWVLAKFNFSPSQLLDKAATESGEGAKFLGPGLYLTTPALVISTGLTIFFGTAGLPHILMRFFTVPDGKAARQSVVDDRLHRRLHAARDADRLRRLARCSSETGRRRPSARAAPGWRRCWRSSSAAARLRGRRHRAALFSAAAFATILAVVSGSGSRPRARSRTTPTRT